MVARSDELARNLFENGAWTSTTSGAKLVGGPAPPDGAVVMGQDGEELWSWT
jgi:hypothetical protein